MIEHLSEMTDENIESVRAFMRAQLRHSIADLAEASGWSKERAATLADYAVSDPDLAISVVELLAP